MRDLLIIFVKAPEPGSVKTRLTPEISANDAARLYKAMAEDIVEAHADASSRDTAVFFTPPEARDAIAAWLGESHTLVEQEGEDLGARELGALEYAFRSGYEKAVIIGTDCVLLSEIDIDAAFEALDDVPLVLGPSEDGGYYLVGTSEPHPAVFEGIDWGTELVLDQTLERADESQVEYRLLEPKCDVDTWADVTRLIAELGEDARDGRAPRTRKVLKLLGRKKGR
jgi:rSAM/selenodomain-associated transferase 1